MPRRIKAPRATPPEATRPPPKTREPAIRRRATARPASKPAASISATRTSRIPARWERSVARSRPIRRLRVRTSACRRRRMAAVPRSPEHFDDVPASHPSFSSVARRVRQRNQSAGGRVARSGLDERQRLQRWIEQRRGLPEAAQRRILLRPRRLLLRLLLPPRRVRAQRLRMHPQADRVPPFGNAVREQCRVLRRGL